jgi:C-terminal processing protease CtpA/Prc
VTDDGKVIVAKIDAGQSAGQAGIQAGAEIVSWDGKPAMQAVEESLQSFTDSSRQTILSMKTRAFGRAPAGATIHIEYRNPGATDVSAADLAAVEIPNENIGLSSACYQAWKHCEPANLPVWIEWLPSNIAVLHMRTFTMGMQGYRLLIDSWEQALTQLNNSDARGLIIDLRQNDVLDNPLIPMYMAGSFFTEPFPLADITQVDAAGNDVTVANLALLPAPVQWDRPVAVLVDEWCKNVCEVFTLAMTHRPDTIIAGMSPTGGSLASAMEPVLLPTGNFVLVVDQAYRDPATHEILIQGKGIEPTLRVPKTAEAIVGNVTDDLVMHAAEQALEEQIAGVNDVPTATPQP